MFKFLTTWKSMAKLAKMANYLYYYLFFSSQEVAKITKFFFFSSQNSQKTSSQTKSMWEYPKISVFLHRNSHFSEVVL